MDDREAYLARVEEVSKLASESIGMMMLETLRTRILEMGYKEKLMGLRTHIVNYKPLSFEMSPSTRRDFREHPEIFLEVIDNVLGNQFYPTYPGVAVLNGIN